MAGSSALSASAPAMSNSLTSTFAESLGSPALAAAAATSWEPAEARAEREAASSCWRSFKLFSDAFLSSATWERKHRTESLSSKIVSCWALTSSSCLPFAPRLASRAAASSTLAFSSSSTLACRLRRVSSRCLMSAALLFSSFLKVCSASAAADRCLSASSCASSSAAHARAAWSSAISRCISRSCCMTFCASAAFAACCSIIICSARFSSSLNLDICSSPSTFWRRTTTFALDSLKRSSACMMFSWATRFRTSFCCISSSAFCSCSVAFRHRSWTSTLMSSICTSNLERCSLTSRSFLVSSSTSWLGAAVAAAWVLSVFRRRKTCVTFGGETAPGAASLTLSQHLVRL
mmetsp:Transcript_127141/g.406772  ORF Transcript_127141/g.406772 Transcript_127141/m.406772 type:complete len:349 (+) Transcript_127141:849-1895(+)